MSEWNKDEIRKINGSDDLHISPFRTDGKTYGTPTWIWSVFVNGALYVRAYNGKNSSWYKAAVSQKAGRIQAAGIIKEVNFEQADAEEKLNNMIDDAYRKKYGGSPYLNSMISDGPRSATIKIIPKN